MWCPQCASNTNVKATVRKEQTHRFRDCPSCGYVFQTIEAPKDSSFWKEYEAKLKSSNAVS